MADAGLSQNEEATGNGGTLLLFGGALGDFLCLLPGLFALRRQNPQRITIVAQPAFLEIVGQRRFGTVSIDRREIADLFSTGSILDSTLALFSDFATVHSWIGHGDDNFAARLEAASGGKVQIHRLRGMRRAEHASTYLARCLDVQPTPISLDPSPDATHWVTELWHRHGLADATLILHPGSGSRSKNWQGMESIAQRWRAESSGQVIVLCGPAERSVDVPHDVLVREPSLHRIAALLRKGAAYLGNDSGVSHLAGLAGARGVVTFGPSDPTTWRPLGDGLYVCRAETTVCELCDATEFCTHVLRIDDVWERLRERFSRQDILDTVPPPSQTAPKQGKGSEGRSALDE